MTLASNSQIRSLPQVSVKAHADIRCDEKEKKIENAHLPTDSPESEDDESEAGDAQESLDDLPYQAVEERTFAGNRESRNGTDE